MPNARAHCTPGRASVYAVCIGIAPLGGKYRIRPSSLFGTLSPEGEALARSVPPRQSEGRHTGSRPGPRSPRGKGFRPPRPLNPSAATARVLGYTTSPEAISQRERAHNPSTDISSSLSSPLARSKDTSRCRKTPAPQGTGRWGMGVRCLLCARCLSALFSVCEISSRGREIPQTGGPLPRQTSSAPETLGRRTTARRAVYVLPYIIRARARPEIARAQQMERACFA